MKRKKERKPENKKEKESMSRIESKKRYKQVKQDTGNICSLHSLPRTRVCIITNTRTLTTVCNAWLDRIY